MAAVDLSDTASRASAGGVESCNGNNDTPVKNQKRKRLSDNQVVAKVCRILDEKETDEATAFFDEAQDGWDRKDEEKKNELYDKAMRVAKLTDGKERDGSRECINALLEKALNIDSERFEKDVYEFPNSFASMLEYCSDKSVERLVQGLELFDHSQAMRFAPSLAEALEQRKIPEKMPQEDAVKFLQNLPAVMYQVLAEMIGCKTESMGDDEMQVRVIHHFCPKDNDNIVRFIEYSTDPEEKGKLLLNSGKLELFAEHVGAHSLVHFEDYLTLDQCETLALQTDKSKALYRTLAAAFDRLGKPFEAFDHMVHCRDLMETSTSLKESIIVKHQIALKKLIGQSDRNKNSPASNAQVKESDVEAIRSDLSALQEKVKYLEDQNKIANKCCKGLNTRLEDVRKEVGSLSGKVESLRDIRG